MTNIVILRHKINFLLETDTASIDALLASFYMYVLFCGFHIWYLCLYRDIHVRFSLSAKFYKFCHYQNCFSGLQKNPKQKPPRRKNPATHHFDSSI